jgi:phenylacetate-CoA ligase
VITNLGRIGYPIIRYRTGDLVQLNQHPCDCGRSFVRFEGGVIGRADDMVIVRGVNVYPSAIENLIREFDEVDEFRVTVTERKQMADLGIEVELVDGTNASSATEAITKAFQNTLGLRPTVTAVPRETLPRFELKAKRFQVKGETRFCETGG